MGRERVWAYHRQTNAIDFNPSHVPGQGAEIRVTYWPADC